MIENAPKMRPINQLRSHFVANSWSNPKTKTENGCSTDSKFIPRARGLFDLIFKIRGRGSSMFGIEMAPSLPTTNGKRWGGFEVLSRFVSACTSFMATTGRTYGLNPRPRSIFDLIFRIRGRISSMFGIEMAPSLPTTNGKRWGASKC